jgi:hypothetical protein
MGNNWIRVEGGGSGATVLTDYSSEVIRKSSKTKITSDRLYSSLLHQSAFESEFLQHPFATARVLSYRRKGQQFLVDMLRLNGPTLLEYSLFSPASEVIRVSEGFLKSWLSLVFDSGVIPGVEVDQLFANKLQEIVDRLHASKRFSIAYACQELFYEIQPISIDVNKARFVHGDLTISNLILIENNLFGLIDFTPQNICIVEIDIAKFLQEFLLGWSIRHSPDYSTLAFRLRLIGYKIIDMIHGSINCINMDVVAKSFVLNFLRIAPYLHSKVDCDSWIRLLPSVHYLYRVISNPAVIYTRSAITAGLAL